MLQKINRVLARMVRRAKQDQRQRGEGLLSLLLYVGGVALVVGLLAYIAYRVYRGYQMNVFNTGMIQLVQNVRNSGNGNYPAGSLFNVLNDQNLIPIGFTPNGAGAGTITHPFGGQVVVTGAGGTFTVDLTLMPQDACINISAKPYSETALTINGTGLVVTPPPTTALTDGQCAAGTANDSLFTFQ